MFIATMAGAMSGWQMTRRELIKLLISAVGSWPIAADAQQSSEIVQIGVLSGGAATELTLVLPRSTRSSRRYLCLDMSRDRTSPSNVDLPTVTRTS
jgi:hypothetical protein